MSAAVIIRAAFESDAPALGRLVVDTWRETYSGIFPDDFFVTFTYEQQIARARTILGDPARRARMALAVTAAEDPVGFALAGPNADTTLPFDSELHTLYLLKAHNGHGIGKALLGFVVDHEVAANSESFFTWVVAANPTRAFYEHLGGVNLGISRNRLFGSQIVTEVALGWPDINQLQARLR